MAIELKPVATTASEERTSCVIIQTPKNSDPHIQVIRQFASTKEDGSIEYKPAPNAERYLSAVATEAHDFTPSQPSKITIAEVAGLMSLIADTWRHEDIDAAAKATVESTVQ